MSKLIKVDTRSYNHIAIISLNRPEAMNALSKELLKQLQDAIDYVTNKSTIFCTILIGEGERAFCAGADLKERHGMDENEVLEAVQRIGDTVLRVEKMPMPVIAALNGVAFGGGLELALGCDLRIAADDIQLGLTETSLAIIPGAGGTQRLPRLIGLGRAKQLIYTAKRISAKEAAQYGIVEKVVEASELFEEAISLAQSIVGNGPIALQEAKRAINEGSDVDLATALAIERASYEQTLRTADRIEGLEAFKEKRQPVYRGK